MGVAAGMVVVTPHFPFTSAYRVADELVGEVAKQAKAALVDVDGHPVPCVSMAMHLQLDSTAGSVERIDEDLTVRGRRLSAMPYAELVGVGEPVRELSPDSAAWLRGRGLDELWSLAQALVERDAERRRVRSSAQLHELRLRLRPDPAAADEYIGRLVDADSARWRALLEGERSLFTERDGGPTTRFLDALSLGPYLTEYEAADA